MPCRWTAIAAETKRNLIRTTMMGMVVGSMLSSAMPLDTVLTFSDQDLDTLYGVTTV